MNIRNSLFGVAGLALALAACSGGTTPGIPSSPSGPPPGAPASQSISPASGGTLTVQFIGGGSAALTIPAGALSKPATVTLAAVTTAAALPKTFASSARKTQSIPAGSTFLTGFTIDLGGATLTKPMQITESIVGGATVPSGNVVRLAMYSTKTGNFTDVDTAAVSGTSATNNNAAGYVGISSGTGNANPYAFYAVPSASAATPAPLVLGAVLASPAPLQINGGTAVYNATGADANGNPYAFPAATFAVADLNPANPSGDTVTPSSTNPLQATVSLGIGAANLVVTDPISKQSGSTLIAILPQRPGATGDTFNYSGTLTRSDTYAYPSPTLPPSNTSANVTQTITATNTSDPKYNGANVLFSNAETDAYPFQTLSNTTTLAFLSTFTTFNLTGYQTVDDIGDTTTVQYTTPQVADKLPETSGASWSNSPAATITQVFGKGSTATASRTVNADGSYTDNELVGAAPAPAPTDYPAVNAALVENSDGSGNYKITFHQNGRVGRPANQDVIDNYVISAPTGGNISYSYQTYAITSPTAPTPAPVLKKTFASWIPSGAPLYSERNTQSGSTTIPTNCNVPAALGTTGNKLQQVVTAYDTILGTATTTTTTQYVIAGFGPACVQMTSNIVSYYDYNLDFVTGPQSSFSVMFGNTPLQTTTITETLAQPTGSPVVQSGGRKTQAVSGIAPITAFAIANARASIVREQQRDRGKRVQAIVRQLENIAGKGAR